MLSRKKDKKKLRKKLNKVNSRVHNTDCLLKKIKAKYLKYLFLTLRELSNNIDTRKFDQCKEVRNLNIHHNRARFLNLTVAELLVLSGVVSKNEMNNLNSEGNGKLFELLLRKVKDHYQFDFLRSDYYREWVRDPIKIYQSVRT